MNIIKFTKFTGVNCPVRKSVLRPQFSPEPFESRKFQKTIDYFLLTLIKRKYQKFIKLILIIIYYLIKKIIIKINRKRLL